MIDTLVLRLHGLTKYSRPVQEMNMTNKKGFDLGTAIVDPDEVQDLQKKGKNPTQIFNILHRRGTGEFLARTQKGAKKITSSHYEISYSINLSDDFIEFNFSVPKYIYGSNVFMYIEHSWDRDYKYYENSLLEYNIRKAPDAIMNFINYFIWREFPLDKIDLEDVEINRIDLCFNQIFNSKEDALYYHKYQNKIKKKHSREEDGKTTIYETSLTHVTSRFGAKIYHKGSEYKSKGDKSHHLKMNEEKRYQVFDVDKIQELADRTLRYEITFRKAELNYLFKQNIFRKNCPLFKIDYANYQRISAINQRNNRNSKNVGNLPENERETYLKFHPYEKVSREDKSTFKYVSKLIETSPEFRLKVSQGSHLFNTETIHNMICYSAPFTKELIRLCCKKLVDYIEQFQLMELPDEEIVSIKIDTYNLTQRRKLPKAEMMQFYDLLVRTGSFKEASRLSRYSKATLYRYKDRFKKIGITQNNLKPEEKFPIPKGALDLKEYHAFTSRNSHLIRKGRFIYE